MAESPNFLLNAKVWLKPFNLNISNLKLSLGSSNIKLSALAPLWQQTKCLNLEHIKTSFPISKRETLNQKF